MWPFNIRAKKKAKRLAESETQKERDKVRMDKNSIVFKALAEAFIKEQVAKYIAANPQPFQEGQFVDIIYYGYVHHKGWLPSAKEMCKYFGKDVPELNGPATLKVKKCYVDTTWLSDRLDYKYDNRAHDIISESKDENEVKGRFHLYTLSILNNDVTPVEWAVIIDWDFHQFRYDTINGRPTDKKSHLVLRWECPASTFISSGTPLAIKQKALYLREEGILSAKKIYDEQYQEIQNEIKLFSIN